MRICVFGIEGIAAGDLLSDERLLNLRRLMDLGVYGFIHEVKGEQSRSVWKTMATARRSASQSPHAERAIWDVVASAEGRCILAELPPDAAGPPDSIRVASIANSDNLIVEPADVAAEIVQALGSLTELPVGDAGEKHSEVAARGRLWNVVRWLLQEKKWKYFHTIDADAGQTDYALRLDEQIGACLELMEEPTVLLVMSCGARTADTPGAFIVVAPECPLSGEYEGASLVDIAPTLLDLAGYVIPDSMEGRSLVAGLERKTSDSDNQESEQERLVRERLSGLGYI